MSRRTVALSFGIVVVGAALYFGCLAFEFWLAVCQLQAGLPVNTPWG
jgi:hypothetical protein